VKPARLPRGKLEIRNSKLERNSKAEIQIVKLNPVRAASVLDGSR